MNQLLVHQLKKESYSMLLSYYFQTNIFLVYKIFIAFQAKKENQWSLLAVHHHYFISLFLFFQFFLLKKH